MSDIKKKMNLNYFSFHHQKLDEIKSLPVALLAYAEMYLKTILVDNC